VNLGPIEISRSQQSNNIILVSFWKSFAWSSGDTKSSAPVAEEVNNEIQENSKMLFSLSEPMCKMPHKIPPHKCETRELKIKCDLKPYFKDDHLENLRENFF